MALAACSHNRSPVNVVRPTASRALSSEDRRTYEVGVQLARRDRLQTQERRAAMSRIVRVDAVIASENEEGIVLRVTIANLTAKTIAGIDAGVQVVDVRGGRRIGLQELYVDRTVRPHVRMTLVEPRRYATFGEDAGSMRLALGRPKRVWIDVLGVRYAGQHEGDAD